MSGIVIHPLVDLFKILYSFLCQDMQNRSEFESADTVVK
jgi:hypothetical protein